MGDLKTLPSSLRETQRYIVFEVLSDRTPEFGDVVEEVWDEALDLLGQKGVAEADPWIIRDLYEDGRGGIRVRKGEVEELRAALALITEIGGKDATVQVLGVTGTIDSARDKYF